MKSHAKPPVSSSEIDLVALVQRYQTGLWRYLRGLGCDSATADDLVQETFLKVLQRPFEYFDDGATAAFLRRVAHNQFVSNHRRAGKVVSVENVQQFERVWCELVSDQDGDDYLEALRECFLKLGDRSRWALEMRFRQRLSRSLIARNLQISEHGAKNLMQRAKLRLRECVERAVGAFRSSSSGTEINESDDESSSGNPGNS
jgi:RNA polymerase sigma-70 factor, ECF subfamily